MPLRRSTTRDTPVTSTPPPPPPQYNQVAIQVAVNAAVTVALEQFTSTSTSGSESYVPPTVVEAPVHSRECSYNDFTNCKPKSFNETGGIIALSQWFEKTESIFEICSYPEGSKVKFSADVHKSTH